MNCLGEGLGQKLGTIIILVEQAPKKTLGRTAIVKLLYLLQEGKKVPLGYDFRLYTFGPFDPDILNDMETAQSFQALQIRTVTCSSSYRYEIKAGNKSEDVKACVARWLQDYRDDLNWISTTFARRPASELELMATIVYVDHEMAGESRSGELGELAKRVRGVKPRFDEKLVLSKCQEAKELGLLIFDSKCNTAASAM